MNDGAAETSLEHRFEAGRNNFNLVRLLAALAVIYGHANAVTGHGPPDLFIRLVPFKFLGGVAVDVFFVLSGFLVTASAMSGKGARYYWVSRALRIYPALLVCILLSVFVLGPALTVAGNYWNSGQTWAYLWGNASAWKTQYFLPGVFSSLKDQAVNGSLWSLAVEVRLYVLTWALAVVGILQRRALFNALFFSLVVAAYLVPSVGTTLVENDTHRWAAFMFALGAFAWVNRRDIPVSAPVLLLLLFAAALQFRGPAFAVPYALLLPYLVFHLGFAKGFDWFSRMGDYSYGVYLYGWPAQQLVAQTFPSLENWQHALCASALALSAAALSWHLVEKSALGLRDRIGRRREHDAPPIEPAPGWGPFRRDGVAVALGVVLFCGLGWRVITGEAAVSLAAPPSEPFKLSSVQVTAWGPQSADRGTVPNAQGSGHMGLWMKLSKPIKPAGVEVLFGDTPADRTDLREGVIAAGIAPTRVSKQGGVPVRLRHVTTGEEFVVGTFEVR